MVLCFDQQGMVDRTKLDEKEISVFIAFLESERKRHQQDIDQINKDIKDMKSRKRKNEF